MRHALILVLLVNACLLGIRAFQEALPAQAGGQQAQENGDTNGDGNRDISDAIYYLSWLFQGGPEPVALAQGEFRSPAHKQVLDALTEHMSVELLPNGDDGELAKTIRFSGVNLQIVNGTDSGSRINGLGNLIVGYQGLREEGNERSGSHNLVVGNENNYSSWGGLVAGTMNSIEAQYACVIGGELNAATGVTSCVLGGRENLASGTYSSVSGGFSNEAASSYSVVAGGNSNLAGDKKRGPGRFGPGNLDTEIADGELRWATRLAAVYGGAWNKAISLQSVIVGGHFNTAGDEGGVSNQTADETIDVRELASANASCFGGNSNTAASLYSVVSGGQENRASGRASSVSGGRYNWARGDWSSVTGGGGEEPSGQDGIQRIEIPVHPGFADIEVGSGNIAGGAYSTVSGGSGNVIQDPSTPESFTGKWTTVGGGFGVTTGASKQASVGVLQIHGR